MDIKIMLDGVEVDITSKLAMACIGMLIDIHSALTKTNPVENAEMLLECVKQVNEEEGEIQLA